MDSYAGLYLVRRDEWEARPAARLIPPVKHTHLEIHHGASNNARVRNSPRAVLRGYQRGHLDKGWSDLFYNLALDQNNVLYEGRGVGWKSQGTALTVVMMGNFEEIAPTPEMLGTLKHLAVSLPRGVAGLDWHKRRAEGTKFASECPGKVAIAEIQKIMKLGASIPTAKNKKGLYMEFADAWYIVTNTYKDAWGIPGDAEGILFWTEMVMKEGFVGFAKFIRALAAVGK